MLQIRDGIQVPDLNSEQVSSNRKERMMKTTVFSKRLYLLLLTFAMMMMLTLIASASTAEVTIKAPAKGSISCWFRGKGDITTLEAGGSDIIRTIDTSKSSQELVFTADGVSEVDDCYLWKWTANASTPTQVKGGEYIHTIEKGDTSKWVFWAEDTHVLTFHYGWAPTDTMDGRADYYRCASCGRIYDENKNKLDSYAQLAIHELKPVSQVDATCTSTGIKAYYKCSNCEKIFSDSAGITEIEAPEVIPVKPHILAKTAQTDPTCEKEGTKAYYTCTVCKKMFSDEAGTKEISKPETIAATGHNWDEGTVTKKATTSEDGVLTYTCKNDKSHTKTEVIPREVITVDEDAITPESPSKTSLIKMALLNASFSWKSDLPGASFSQLQAKGVAKSGSQVKLSWKAVPGAAKYIVYGKSYGAGNKFKKLYEGKKLSYTDKKLKTKRPHKYIVLAVKGKNTVAVSTSVFASPGGASTGNIKKVTIKQKAVALEKGKTKKISTSYTKTKKLKIYRKISFESQNVSVATVNSNGKIKAVGNPGQSTWVYAYGQNGFFAKVKVKIM